MSRAKTSRNGHTGGGKATVSRFRLSEFQANKNRIEPLTVYSMMDRISADSTNGMADLQLIDSHVRFADMRYTASAEAEALWLEAYPHHLLEVVFKTTDGRLIAKGMLTGISAKSTQLAGVKAIAKSTKSRPSRRNDGDSANDRRNIIADAAASLIADKGFAAASMREIAAASNMHVPTMYQYVKSKEEVLELVYKWVIERVKANLSRSLGAELPAEDKMAGIVPAMISSTDGMKRETGVLNRETRSLNRASRERVLGEYAQIIEDVSQVILEGTRTGAFRQVDPLLVANFVDAICDTWALRQFAYGGYDIDTFKREATAFVLGGLSNSQQGSPTKPNK